MDCAPPVILEENICSLLAVCVFSYHIAANLGTITVWAADTAGGAPRLAEGAQVEEIAIKALPGYHFSLRRWRQYKQRQDHGEPHLVETATVLAYMKIRQLTPENYPKASALLHLAFSPSKYEVQLFDKLHENGRVLHEWVCIHRDTVTACVAFSKAFDGARVCGLHLALLAVKPQMQGQGIGSELLRFALRQDAIKERTLFVVGDIKFFKHFGFERCAVPQCPLDKGNAHFLSLRNDTAHPYTVGYEPEFKVRKR